MADWSSEEVELIVADYLEMLQKELKGMAYNKTEHRRRLLPKLDGRSNGSVEMKHMNISAVLDAAGLTYIDGYKPYGHRQQLLADHVIAIIKSDPSIFVEQKAPVHQRGVELTIVEPPTQEQRRDTGDPRFAPIRRDWNLVELRNRLLGTSGEEYIVAFEMDSLRQHGLDHLANQVDHVSQTKGDGLGYDILSFDENEDEKFIEVKTTNLGLKTPFKVSRNEVRYSEQHEDNYYLYRLFRFNLRVPGLFIETGSLSNYELSPTEFEVRF